MFLLVLTGLCVVVNCHISQDIFAVWEKAFCLFILLFSYSPIKNVPFIFYASTGAAEISQLPLLSLQKEKWSAEKSRDDGMNRSWCGARGRSQHTDQYFRLAVLWGGASTSGLLDLESKVHVTRTPLTLGRNLWDFCSFFPTVGFAFLLYFFEKLQMTN